MATEAEQAAVDAVYRERAQLVALLAALWPSTWGIDPEWTDWHVVYVQTPAGQLSWHISPDDRELFGHVLGPADTAWDGHTTAEKYQRVRDLVAQLTQRPDTEADQAAERITAFLGERSIRAGRPNNNPVITSWHGVQLLAPDLRAVLADRAQLQRRLDASPTAQPVVWWLDDGGESPEPDLYTSEAAAQKAAVDAWKAANPFTEITNLEWLYVDSSNGDPHVDTELNVNHEYTGHVVRARRPKGGA